MSERAPGRFTCRLCGVAPLARGQRVGRVLFPLPRGYHALVLENRVRQKKQLSFLFIFHTRDEQQWRRAARNRRHQRARPRRKRPRQRRSKKAEVCCFLLACDGCGEAFRLREIERWSHPGHNSCRLCARFPFMSSQMCKAMRTDSYVSKADRCFEDVPIHCLPFPHVATRVAHPTLSFRILAQYAHFLMFIPHSVPT